MGGKKSKPTPREVKHHSFNFLNKRILIGTVPRIVNIGR